MLCFIHYPCFLVFVIPEFADELPSLFAGEALCFYACLIFVHFHISLRADF
ncbi:hypothetical protein GV51_1007 [Gardnerella vaginalis 5-1]|nr:hypothetical protein GV51_1007 [Gardnerella vaginalis 5-1]